jgi:hypothetical protein
MKRLFGHHRVSSGTNATRDQALLSIKSKAPEPPLRGPRPPGYIRPTAMAPKDVRSKPKLSPT